MRTVGAVASVLLVLLLDAFASFRIVHSDVTSRPQKLAWLLFTWLVPLAGAILALQIASERSTPAPVVGSFESGPEAGIALSSGGSVGGPSVDGSSGGDVSAH